MRGLTPPLQDGGVAGFQAKRGYLHQRVGPRFEHGGDDAQRTGDAPERELLIEQRRHARHAQRIGQSGHRAHAVRHLRDFAPGEFQTLEQRLGHLPARNERFRLGHVFRVRFEDSLRVLINRVRHGGQGAIPHLIAQGRQRECCAPRRKAYGVDITQGESPSSNLSDRLWIIGRDEMTGKRIILFSSSIPHDAARRSRG